MLDLIFNGFNEFYFGRISRFFFNFNFLIFANISVRFIRYMDIESSLSNILLGFPSLRYLFVALFVYTVMFVHVSFLNSLSQLNFVLDVGVSRGCVCTALLRADSNKIKLSL